MKKKVSHLHALLLLPLATASPLLCMEKESLSSHEKYPLEESVIVPHMPKTRGLGITRTLKDLIWYEEENTYSELAAKTLDLDNSSNHRKIDSAVEIYSTKENSDRLTSMFELCREEPCKGVVKINDIPAAMAHNFLVKKNKDKQNALKEAIEKKDKDFIAEYNALLNVLQENLSHNVKAINSLLDNHLKDRNVLVEKEGNDIRKLKKGLVHLHHLNKQLRKEELLKNSYCSDDEKDADNVNSSYNDSYLLKKINIEYDMTQTKVKAENTLKQIYKFNDEIQAIETVRY